MSTVRTMAGGWVNRKQIERGENGRGLCRWCSLEVPPRRFTFCSEYCVHEWKLRSQPRYLREQILKRDKGVCAHCGLNTLKEYARLRRARGAARVELLRLWGVNPRIRKSLWDADHILPVAEGGGECDLKNIRTLCLRCHRVVTAQLRERIRRARVAAMLAAEKAEQHHTCPNSFCAGQNPSPGTRVAIRQPRGLKDRRSRNETLIANRTVP